jgi:hypothetical protein
METKDKKLNDEFLCKICNKQYKNKSGIWKHNKKYHLSESVKNQSYISHISAENQPIISQISANEIKDNQKQEQSGYKCKYCPKIFKHIQSRWKHEHNCKEQIKESDYIELKKENAEIKSMLMEILKSSKIHPKTLQKINKNLVNGNNNNVNNGTVNNIQIVKFGSEDIKQILNEKEVK